MSKSPSAEFTSSAGAVMLRVPAGSFTMGSPESEDGNRVWEQEREVTFTSDFYLGKTPVTQDQFTALTGTNPMAMSGNGVRTGTGPTAGRAIVIPIDPFAGGAISAVPASAVRHSVGAGIRT